MIAFGSTKFKFPFSVDRPLIFVKSFPVTIQWGYPAKDRSGQLEVVEEPHLGKLLTKISGRSTDKGDLNFVDPNTIKSSDKETK